MGGIKYTGVSGSAGGGFDAANNGLSPSTVSPTTTVVLGQDANEAGNPAMLLDTRQIPMNDNILWFQLDGNPKNSIYINGDGPIDIQSGENSRWDVWTPTNYGTDYAPWGTANRWICGFAEFDGVNLPTSPRPNVVGQWWGYNTEFNGGRIDNTEASFRYATETFFVIGPNDSFEFHTPEITTTSGQIFRLDSNYVARQTGKSFRQLVCDDLALYEITHNVSTGQFIFDLHYDSGADQTFLELLSQNTGGVTVIQMGNWVDGNSQLVFNGGLFRIQSVAEISFVSDAVATVASVRTCLAGVGGTVVSSDPTDTPEGDSRLAVHSTTQGFRPPSMTTTQKNAIAPVSGGLVVYDETLNKLCLWTGAAWETVTSV